MIIIYDAYWRDHVNCRWTWSSEYGHCLDHDVYFELPTDDEVFDL